MTRHHQRPRFLALPQHVSRHAGRPTRLLGAVAGVLLAGILIAGCRAPSEAADEPTTVAEPPRTVAELTTLQTVTLFVTATQTPLGGFEATLVFDPRSVALEDIAPRPGFKVLFDVAQFPTGRVHLLVRAEGPAQHPGPAEPVAELGFLPIRSLGPLPLESIGSLQGVHAYSPPPTITSVAVGAWLALATPSFSY